MQMQSRQRHPLRMVVGAGCTQVKGPRRCLVELRDFTRGQGFALAECLPNCALCELGSVSAIVCTVPDSEEVSMIDRSLNYGRGRIADFAGMALPFGTAVDLGAGRGTDLESVRAVNPHPKLFGVEDMTRTGVSPEAWG